MLHLYKYTRYERKMEYLGYYTTGVIFPVGKLEKTAMGLDYFLLCEKINI